MAVVPVPRRSSIAARNIDEWITEELALSAAYQKAVLEELKRRNALAVTPYEVAQCEKKLVGVLAAHAERELNRTLRRVDGLRHNLW
jgi:hypothetical protein